MLGAAGLLLAGCASLSAPSTETDPYPALLPIDDLLAEADAALADPGPPQVQRAASSQDRAAILAP
ncbi:MAG: hypothetical protein B7Z10_00830 [Rhodobacterales bacterium 32-66-7]|nr:MAG: hypothetical protein B7Z10_00830 [Rhodobacterales bacterium 32-66-7]